MRGREIAGTRAKEISYPRAWHRLFRLVTQALLALVSEPSQPGAPLTFNDKVAKCGHDAGKAQEVCSAVFFPEFARAHKLSKPELSTSSYAAPVRLDIQER